MPELKNTVLARKNKVLVTLADVGFLPQAKQLFASVWLKAAWDGDYLLLTNNIPPHERQWFESRGIIVYDQPLLANRPIGRKPCPPIHLSKFYLFTEYFQAWQQVFFLDADIIVRLPFANLFAPQRLSAVFAAPLLLEDEVEGVLRSDWSRSYNLKRLAFSSGVMAFDTKIITADTFDSLLNFYRQHQASLPFNEESTLNFFFYHYRRLSLLSYNAVPWFLAEAYYLTEERLAARILHFAYAKVRPWDAASPYFPEWSDNLRCAEEINFLATPPPAAKPGWRFVISELSQTYMQPRLIKIDRFIGLVGLSLKSRYPRIYFLLKKIIPGFPLPGRRQ